MSFWNKVGELAKTALEKVPDVAAALVNEAQKQQMNHDRAIAAKVREYERKVERAESKKDQMSPEQRRKLQEAREKVESAKRKMGEKGVSVSSGGTVTYGSRTVEQWNSRWESIGRLKDANLTPFNKSVGLYRLKMDSRIMYIGRAVELNNGGFRKRLSDYRRDSDSARRHKSGSTIYENLDSISVDVLVVGTDQDAIEVTKKLEGPFIQKYQPPWNKMLK